MRTTSLFVASGLATALSSTGLAGFTGDAYVDLSMVSTDGSVNLFNPNGFQTLNGTYVFIGGAPFGQSNLDYTIALSSEVANSGILGGSMGDTDTVGFDIVVENNSTSTHQYTLGISAGVTTPWSMGTLVGGGVLGVLTDVNGNGGIVSNIGSNPLLEGTIDGNGVLAVGAAPFTVTSAPNSSQTFAFANGLPGPFAPGPMDVNSTYGLILSFTLGAGDSLVITGEFQVMYIPGPASLAVLALGVSAGRRRRRD